MDKKEYFQTKLRRISTEMVSIGATHIARDIWDLISELNDVRIEPKGVCEEGDWKKSYEDLIDHEKRAGKVLDDRWNALFKREDFCQKVERSLEFEAVAILVVCFVADMVGYFCDLKWLILMATAFFALEAIKIIVCFIVTVLTYRNLPKRSKDDDEEEDEKQC